MVTTNNRCRASLVAAILWLTVTAAHLNAADAPANPLPATPAPAAAPVPSPLEITMSSDGICVYATGAQADELFMELARKTGVGIIVDDTVGRREGDKFVSRSMTVSLTNKKLTEVIDKICTAYGLSYSQAGGVFMISEGIPKNPSSYLMSDIDSITTEYVVASKARSLLPVFLQDHVKVNDGQNAVVLSAPKQVLTKFREDIKQFDVPAAQIMIDVMMVEVKGGAAKELGFDLDWSNAGESVTSLPGSGDIIFRSLGSGAKAFAARISAMVEKEQAKVRANPRIATISGQSASIFVGRQRYVSQSVDGKNYIDAGISLNMTPWTGGDGVIIAEVHPEVSVMSAPDPITQLPEKSTRRANTVVRVKDGDTIVIGGLCQTELQKTRARIPVVGQLPLVGSLFTRTDRDEVETEMIILITPHIMSQTGHLSGEREKELLQPFGDLLKDDKK